MGNVTRYVVLLAVLFAGTAAALTSAAAQDSTPTAGGGERFVVVTHGQAADPFWSVVQRGVEQAAQDYGVTAEYQAPTTFDMVQMGQLIDAAVASQPDGLVVSIPDADALRDPVQRAIDAGIPVVSINSGSEVAEELGVLTHVGQTEYEAGLAGGERMAEAGVTNAICFIQEQGNAGLEERCRGFADGMRAAGGTVENIAGDLNDPTSITQRIQASGREVQLATFDLSSDVLQAIQAGDILFAIDQQQYLQGYLPITLLTLYSRNLNTIANPVLM
ncbi:MAG: sugar ABC transporter substrate-binding protein, partial [Chloroflexota bacterium]|nr:sugar ABC transporter substrate-binding protein [Chloroflexota bacterium]